MAVADVEDMQTAVEMLQKAKVTRPPLSTAYSIYPRTILPIKICPDKNVPSNASCTLLQVTPLTTTNVLYRTLCRLPSPRPPRRRKLKKHFSSKNKKQNNEKSLQEQPRLLMSNRLTLITTTIITTNPSRKIKVKIPKKS